MTERVRLLDQTAMHTKQTYEYIAMLGRAIAQAVSRWLPTAAARVRSQVRSCEICGGQSSTGAGFIRVLQFPLPILIPPTTPHSSIIRGWYNMPNIGRRTKWTPSHPTPRGGELYRYVPWSRGTVCLFFFML
jgi:hypothetical protein